MASQAPSDGELVRAVAEGHLDALRVLHGRLAPVLKARLGRRCADPEIVDESIQDTFVAVWQGARRFSGQGEVAAWVWGIAIRRLIGRLRHHGALRRSDASAHLAFDEPSAEELVLLGVQYGDLGAAINHLSPELRAVLQATVLDGLTMREAARMLHIPTGTVKTRLVRARAQLREQLT